MSMFKPTESSVVDVLEEEGPMSVFEMEDVMVFDRYQILSTCEQSEMLYQDDSNRWHVGIINE